MKFAKIISMTMVLAMLAGMSVGCAVEKDGEVSSKKATEKVETTEITETEGIEQPVVTEGVETEGTDKPEDVPNVDEENKEVYIKEWQEIDGKIVPYPENETIEVMPGDIVSKIVTVVSDEDDVRVRAKIEITIRDPDGNVMSLSEDQINEILTLNIDTAKWSFENGYYYYSDLIGDGAETSPLFTEVAFATDIDNSYQHCSVEINVVAEYVDDDYRIVKNTMTAGKVDITSLDETKVDVYGAPVDGAARVTENEYKLIPGHKYTKDPVLVIAGGSEDSFVYVEVINEIAAIEAGGDSAIAAQMASFGWTELPGVANVYYKNYTAQETELHYNIFECFEVADGADVAEYVDKTIQVKGYAVQADGFADAKAAWDYAAFDSYTAKNVMVVGNVDIEQNEWERDAYGNLVEFTQGKVLYPAINPNMQWSDDVIDFSNDPINANGGSQKLFFAESNAVDKFITVTNTGHNDVYVRTLVAFECGDMDFDKFNDLVGYSYYDIGWTIASITDTTIDGVNYQVIEFVFKGRNGEQGVLAAGDTTQASLCQVYLTSDATSEDVAALDGNGNGLYDIMVLSQATQAEGWSDSMTALDTAFGDVTAENVTKWFEK